MQLRIKTYKLWKTKKYFKKFSFFFIFNTFTFKTLIAFKQFNSSYYKLSNSTTKKLLKNANLKAFWNLPQGSTVLVWPKNKVYFFSNKNLRLVGIKLNNKIYILSQLNHLIQYSYFKNTLLKTKILNFFLQSIKMSK